MTERVQGGRLAARAIAAEGVDVLFTLSGGHVMPVYEGCRHEGVRVVDVRHEQSAAHAAEAWGRVQRSCGVALVTAGPGVTGRLTVHFRHLTPIGEQLTFDAWIDHEEGRRMLAKATCHAADGTLCAEAEGLFIKVDFEAVQQMMRDRRGS